MYVHLRVPWSPALVVARAHGHRYKYNVHWLPSSTCVLLIRGSTPLPFPFLAKCLTSCVHYLLIGGVPRLYPFLGCLLCGYRGSVPSPLMIGIGPCNHISSIMCLGANYLWNYALYCVWYAYMCHDSHQSHYITLYHPHICTYMYLRTCQFYST